MIRELDSPFRFSWTSSLGAVRALGAPASILEGPESEAGGVTGTWIEDRVTYRLPWGTLGRAAHVAGVGRRIRALFDFREGYLRDRFGPV